MMQETIKIGYRTNILMLKLFPASKKTFDLGKVSLANKMYNQAENHRKYMRQAVSLSWLETKR
jgi:hypothetical protein